MYYGMILQNPNETMFEHWQSILASLLEDRIRLMESTARETKMMNGGNRV